MDLDFNLYGVLLLVTGTIAGLISVVTSIKPIRAVKTFAWMMAGVGIWCFGYAFELSSQTLEGMLFFIRIQYIGITLIPVSWLLFCFRFSRYGSWINSKSIFLLSLYPSVTLLLVWTNGLHGFHYAATSVVEQGGMFLLNIEVGPWYVVHTILFYLHMLAGFLVLIRKYRTANDIIKNQLRIIICGVLIPWIANALYLMGIRPFGHIDMTPFAFVMSGIIVAIGLTRFKLFKILPIARERIIEEMKEGILILDEQMQILDSNPSMRMILDEIESDLLTETMLSTEDGTRMTLIDLLAHKRPPSAELEVGLSGSKHFYELSVNPFLNKIGKMTGFFIVFRDITAQKEANLEIIRSREQAEAANRAKSDFLAHMSHEIRTPLNGVIGFVDLLLETELSGTQRRYMSTVYNSAHSLLDIVNDILDLSKIEAGKLELNLEETDVRDLCREAFDMFSLQAGKKELRLNLFIAAEAPARIMADQVRLRQIITNLLANAIKFTNEGEIELRVEIIFSPEEEKRLRFSLRDTGIGIAEENQKRIFDSFAQEDVSTTRKYSGTGLGLAISNQLLDLMDSGLNLESTKGEGSHFYFDLPLSAVSDETIGDDYHYQPSVDESLPNQNPDEHFAEKSLELKTQINDESFKMLVADDQSVNLLLVVSVIRRTFPGAEIIEASNGKMAVELYQTQKPDIVFMDVQMPELNGFEATERIRKTEGEQHVPIIALTAGTTREEQKNCFQAGMDDFLSKPVKPESIEKMILKWLDLESAKR